MGIRSLVAGGDNLEVYYRWTAYYLSITGFQNLSSFIFILGENSDLGEVFLNPDNLIFEVIQAIIDDGLARGARVPVIVVTIVLGLLNGSITDIALHVIIFLYEVSTTTDYQVFR